MLKKETFDIIKAVDDKSEGVENAVKSENEVETLKGAVNENVIKTKQTHQNMLRWKNQKGMFSWLVGDLFRNGR